MKPILEGVDIVYPRYNGDRLDLKIESQEDHIIILRRNAVKYNYTTQHMTHRRRYSVEELMKLVNSVEEKYNLAGQEAYFKLYNHIYQGAAFFFHNPSLTQTVTMEFNLTLNNLKIKDGKPNAKSFRVVLSPGQKRYQVLLPIERNIASSISMGYSFSTEQV